mgnify:CR=1 FL=1
MAELYEKIVFVKLFVNVIILMQCVVLFVATFKNYKKYLNIRIVTFNEL